LTSQLLSLKWTLDFSFDAPAAEEAKPTVDVGTGLSLDSLDDFLSEHKAEPEVVEPEAYTSR
jgi:hypothetical protein